MKVPIIDMEATGENIKQLREMQGVSVRQIQEMLGLTNPQAIYKWQRGDNLPSIDNLVILASVLGTSIDDIIVTA